MIYALKRIPQELRRFAVVAIVAGLLTTALIYSRDDVSSEGSESGSKQAVDRQQAKGWFTPTPRTVVSDDKVAEITNAIPLPRARPVTPGFYYELIRAQGDGEGDYVLVERRCIPNVDMPEPCYLPERVRRNFPIRRE
jgi:hypothetical protein